MGVLFEAHKKDVEDYSTNFAGCDLLGRLHEALGIEMADLTNRPEGWAPRPPYTADKAQCQSMAAKLRDALKMRRDVINQVRYEHSYLFTGTTDELCKLIGEWAAWLDSCGGYEMG